MWFKLPHGCLLKKSQCRSCVTKWHVSFFRDEQMSFLKCQNQWLWVFMAKLWQGLLCLKSKTQPCLTLLESQGSLEPQNCCTFGKPLCRIAALIHAVETTLTMALQSWCSEWYEWCERTFGSNFVDRTNITIVAEESAVWLRNGSWWHFRSLVCPFEGGVFNEVTCC